MTIRCALAFVFAAALGAQSPSLVSPKGDFLGSVNSNRFDPNSIANPYGTYGSKYSPKSVNNPYGQYGSRDSPSGATNRYASGAQTPKVIAPNGDYLGDFSANPYAPNSVSNPYGTHGNKYSPNSINNPYGTYGSPYSSSGSRNQFGLGAPPAMPRIPKITFPSFGPQR